MTKNNKIKLKEKDLDYFWQVRTTFRGKKGEKKTLWEKTILYFARESSREWFISNWWMVRQPTARRLNWSYPWQRTAVQEDWMVVSFWLWCTVREDWTDCLFTVRVRYAVPSGARRSGGIQWLHHGRVESVVIGFQRLRGQLGLDRNHIYTQHFDCSTRLLHVVSTVWEYWLSDVCVEQAW